MPIPRQESEKEDAAHPEPGVTTPTKAKCNNGAGHAEPDAEEIEAESDANVEKEFDESTGKKRNYAGPHSYRVIKEWTTGTGPQARLEDAEIKHQNYAEMKNILHASGLKKTPGNKPKETYIHLWKQYSKEYHNKRNNEWT